VDGEGLVNLTLFGQKYLIRTDNADLVFGLARRVQNVLREVMDRDPWCGSGHGAGALVQAAFRLALRLSAAERDNAALTAQTEALEDRIRRLLDIVDGHI
jgi:surfactin synthase thioesterase subunit